MRDYVADIKAYDSNPNHEAIEKLAKRLELTMRNADAALVATSDPAEVARVEKNFAQGTLKATPEAAKEAVKRVAMMMKGDRAKNRITFYYLVAKDLNAFDRL
ncbi:DUF2853 family protein [Bartonella sp. DGB2]|uniref:DUF2853 family protein n=1 Tax=Bartonella sp. DGB2 TaxID=3388426 RepID=UPI00398FA89E